MLKAIDFLAEQVKAQRKGVGLSQDQFAEHVGLSMALISEIERGKANPTVITLEKIATTLGVRIGDLVDAPDDNDTEERLREILLHHLERLSVKQIRVLLTVIMELTK